MLKYLHNRGILKNHHARANARPFDSSYRISSYKEMGQCYEGQVQHQCDDQLQEGSSQYPFAQQPRKPAQHLKPGKLEKNLSTLHMQVMQTIRSRQLLGQGDHLLVAVSGGQDSVCLAKLISDLARVWSWTLHIAHCDHRWRVDSAANALHVKDLAASWGLPFHLRVAPDPPPSSEASARTWRYIQLAELAKELKCGSVLTGHTASDRAETLLFNVIRGSGADGMQALSWKRNLAPDINLVRPLLSVGRKKTGDFCEKHALPVFIDSTNNDNKYRRNLIRNELLPYLQEQFNPKVDEALARTAEVLQDEVSLLEQLATKLVEEALRYIPLNQPTDIQSQSPQNKHQIKQAIYPSNGNGKREHPGEGQGENHVHGPLSSHWDRPTGECDQQNNGCAGDVIRTLPQESGTKSQDRVRLAADLNIIQVAPVALQRRAIRQIMLRLVPDAPLTQSTVEEVMQLCSRDLLSQSPQSPMTGRSSGTSSSITSTGTLTRGIKAYVQGSLLIFEHGQS